MADSNTASDSTSDSNIDTTIERLLFNAYVNRDNHITLIFTLKRNYDKYINDPCRKE